MVKLLEEDTGEDLIHQVFPSSNVCFMPNANNTLQGRFLFCSLRNGTVIYRVLDNTAKVEEGTEEHDQSTSTSISSDFPLRYVFEQGVIR